MFSTRQTRSQQHGEDCTLKPLTLIISLVIILSFMCRVSQISSLLLSNGSELQSPGALSPQKVSQLTPLLPLLGVEFVQQLNPSQLLPVFSALTSVRFTPTQVWGAPHLTLHHTAWNSVSKTISAPPQDGQKGAVLWLPGPGPM